ncbi:MAG: hypothetical protein ABH879_04970 [archaeon]
MRLPAGPVSEKEALFGVTEGGQIIMLEPDPHKIGVSIQQFPHDQDVGVAIARETKVLLQRSGFGDDFFLKIGEHQLTFADCAFRYNVYRRYQEMDK